MKKSFTLAEVLITLGVIGIIAAMTLPALVAKYQQIVLINMWKKHYALLQNAFSMVLADNDYSLGVYDNVNYGTKFAGTPINYGFDASGTDFNGAECSAEYLLK